MLSEESCDGEGQRVAVPQRHTRRSEAGKLDFESVNTYNGYGRLGMTSLGARL